MSLNWATMTSVAQPVTDNTITVTNGALSAAFTFRTRRQPSSTRAFAKLGRYSDKFTLAFIVQDITSYTATGNPLTTFGTLFTEMLIKALRALVWDANSVIPAPGEYLSFGAADASIVESVDMAQMNDQASDTFLITCNLEEASYSTLSSEEEEVPKLNKSDELPPWQMPADVTFDSQTAEGMTLGYAYPTKDLDGTKTYSLDQLREFGLASSTAAKPVVNYADDPFQSPPAMPKVNGTLNVTKSYLRGNGAVNLSGLQGVVNDKTIGLSIVGAQLFFPAATLSPTMLKISPKLYKKPIPWFPKTKHPLSKTYGELFYGYSKTTANKIAINKTNDIIIVYEPLQYIEVSAAFAFRPEGFGVWIANRGYAEKDPREEDGLATITDGAGMMKESWLDASGKKTQTARLWRGFTNMLPSSSVETLLKQFFPEKRADFSWATVKDNFGAALA